MRPIWLLLILVLASSISVAQEPHTTLAEAELPTAAVEEDAPRLITNDATIFGILIVFLGLAFWTYTLKTPVPIHIEYYTVRVDDDGRPHFLADIYQHDHYRRRGRRFDPRRCTATELEHAVNPYVDDGTD